jgi:hypothetical protein
VIVFSESDFKALTAASCAFTHSEKPKAVSKINFFIYTDLLAKIGVSCIVEKQEVMSAERNR